MSETEADTRANRIDPVLRAAGWGVLPGSHIARELTSPGSHSRWWAAGARYRQITCSAIAAANWLYWKPRKPHLDIAPAWARPSSTRACSSCASAIRATALAGMPSTCTPGRRAIWPCHSRRRMSCGCAAFHSATIGAIALARCHFRPMVANGNRAITSTTRLLRCSKRSPRAISASC